MKIICKLDTEDIRIIKRFTDGFKEKEVVIPQTDTIKIYVISDTGVVTELK